MLFNCGRLIILRRLPASLNVFVIVRAIALPNL
jgi:hypothetical protein